MDTEFDLIFQMMGWTNFWDITKLGSRLLTIEFLYTCNIMRGYRFLDVQTRDHVVLERTERPSRFSSRCILDIDTDLSNFERHQFWREISRDEYFFQA